ncbi:MAG: hypothetical protein WCG95_00720, partial [bacterium]
NSVKSQSTTNPTFQANPKTFLKQLKAAGGGIKTTRVELNPSHPNNGEYVSVLMKDGKQLWGSWMDNVVAQFGGSPLRGAIGDTKKSSLQAFLKRIEKIYPQEGKIFEENSDRSGLNLLMDYKA